MLTDSQLEVPVGDARAVLAARFIVTRDGVRRYGRELRASDAWKAEFVGAAALPDAHNRYTALYRRLVAQLLADPVFRAAVR